MKWKKTAYDCPYCDYCLRIYTDNKGNVKRVTKAEKEIVKKPFRVISGN